MIDNIRRPWRYRCPHCGSVTIYRRSPRSVPRPGYGVPGRRLISTGYTREILQYVRRWSCKNCGEIFDSPKDMLLQGEKNVQDAPGRTIPGILV